MLEQDHRFIKKKTKTMLEFKSSNSPLATLDGIEIHHMIKKEQMINPKDKTVLEQLIL
ncbi:MAG: transposase [Francisellaceae bacterium]|nr:transposase [Francisellaceae bacterium]